MTLLAIKYTEFKPCPSLSATFTAKKKKENQCSTKNMSTSPLTSVSDSRYFQPNFLEKVKIKVHLTGLRYKNTVLEKCILASKKNRRISLLKTRATKREQHCNIEHLKDRNQQNWVHFVGVGGCGLSALALIAVKQGFEVSGSDIQWSSFMDGLQQAGVRLHIGHSTLNIQSENGSRFPNCIVVSSAISEDNAEVLHAKSIGIPVYKRDYWLAKLTENHTLIAVSGTHGIKACIIMLLLIFQEREFLWRGTDSVGAHSLLDYTSEGSKPEHASGTMSVTSSDVDGYNIITYGISSTNEWHASSICPNSKGGTDYVLYHKGQPLANISLQIPGAHNVINSLAVIATVTVLLQGRRQVHELINSLKLHLLDFIGLSRCFERIGKIHGCDIYDDYAHHPTEVYFVLQAARQRFPSMRLVVVYSVREAGPRNVCGKDFATSIISSTSEYIPSLVVPNFKPLRMTLNSVLIRTCSIFIFISSDSQVPHRFQDDVVDKLALEICKDPLREIVILTLGAGDVNTVGPKLLHELQKRLCIA
ncbi:hypothetical protein GOBAR_DD05868 [Gossypium barbadense]|nr:hypothetical protein GOBAR_DD05868 [Gossypium barbadense]